LATFGSKRKEHPVKRRVRASAKTRKALEDLFSGRGGGASERSELVKLATRLIVEEALESEVDDRLGRAYYAHGAQAGHRNGYRIGRMKTAEGGIEYAVPQVRGTLTPYRSQIRQALASGRSEELERLVSPFGIKEPALFGVMAPLISWSEPGICGRFKAARFFRLRQPVS
jgi:hypothetical protein